jgi:hypothetical protein
MASLAKASSKDCGSSDTNNSIRTDHIYVWNAYIYTLMQKILETLLTYYISGSRTPGIIKLCATASARRLCGN